VGGYVYAAGGSDYLNSYTDTVERAKLNADGTFGAWENVSSMSITRSSPETLAARGFLYSIGGSTSGYYLFNVDRVPINPDGTLGSWQIIPPTLNIYGPKVVTVNGNIYAIGGTDSNFTSLNSVYVAATSPVSISTFSPSVVLADQTTAIAVTGSNFLPAPMLQLGSTFLATSFVSTTTLTATVPSGLASGWYTVTLTNGDGRIVTFPNALRVDAATPTATPTQTPTQSATPTNTPTQAPTPTATPIFTPTATAISPTLPFYDDFSQGTSKWAMTHGTWQIVNGVFDAVGAGPDVDAWAYAGAESWTDYSTQVRLNMISGNGQVVVRSTGHRQNEYRIELWSNSSGYAPNVLGLASYKNGSAQWVWRQTLPIPVPEIVTVRVDAIGDTIWVYLDGVQWMEYRDPIPMLSGRIGLGVVWNYHAQFDDVAVVALTTTPTPTSTATATSSVTWTPTITPIWTSTPTTSLSNTPTGTPTITPNRTPTRTATPSTTPTIATLYSITGRVTSDGNTPISGVAISDGAGHSAMTDSNGNYVLSGLPSGSYTITPSKTGYTFSPVSRAVVVPPDGIAKDFIGSQTTLPPEPIVLSADSGSSSIRLTWNPTNKPEVALYRISRSISTTVPSFTAIANVADTVFFDNAGLSSGNGYCYKVDALRADNQIVVTSNQACAIFGALELWIPEISAAPGSTAIVPVNIRNANGLQISSADIWIDYNGSVLQSVAISRTVLTEQYAWSSNVQDAGLSKRIKIAAINSQAPMLYGNGSLFWLTFRVLGSSGNSTPLDLREFITGIGGSSMQGPDYNDIPLILRDGTLVVANTYILGDLNGNGVVQSVDALMALDIASGKLTPTWQQQMAGDVNGDGVISGADAAMILYYAANGQWPTPGSITARPARPQNLVVIKLDNAQGRPGETIATTLRGENLFEWAGGDIIVTYDRTRIASITNVATTGIASGFQLSYRDDKNGQLRISLANVNPVSGSGAMATIRFQIANNAPPKSTATLALGSVKLTDLWGRDFATSSLQQVINKQNSQVTILNAWEWFFLPFVNR
jgi:hypothetical protein